MAWPPLSSHSEASSCSTPCCRTDPPWHRGRGRRKHSSSSTSALAPSSTLLSILASLVSASTADASPTPPSFLCPSIGSDDVVPPCCHSRRTPTLRTVDNNSPNQQQSGRAKLRRLPDKFVEGEDGVWRKVTSYTLYGVTGPNPSCNDEVCPPTQISSVGLPLNGTLTTPPPIEIQLPPGWKPSPQSTNSRTTTILAVSLALSLFICFLIVISLFWRRGLNKKKRFRDVEAKHWRRSRRDNCTVEEHRNIEVEREAMALQKIWARASARWRANARHSLRQRRGKRLFTKSHHQSTIPSLNNSRSRLATNTPRPSSPIPDHNQAALAEERQPNEQRENPTSRLSFPPAYHPDHQIPPIVISADEQTTGSVSEYSAPSHLSRQPSQADLSLFSTTAHVATDDKTLLARLADLASAPPTETDAATTMTAEVSAPEDLEFESHIVSPTSTQMDNLPFAASLFPSPPSKERLAAAEQLEYTSYDSEGPEPEPSAPPFEESSAMPPLELPSAPPLIDDEEDRIAADLLPTFPNAPSLEDVVAPSGDIVTEQYHEPTMETQ